MGGCHFHGNKSLPEILPIEIVDLFFLSFFLSFYLSFFLVHFLFLSFFLSFFLSLYMHYLDSTESLQADKHFVIADVCGGIAQGNGSGCSQHDRTIDNTATGMK